MSHTVISSVFLNTKIVVLFIKNNIIHTPVIQVSKYKYEKYITFNVYNNWMQI